MIHKTEVLSPNLINTIKCDLIISEFQMTYTSEVYLVRTEYLKLTHYFEPMYL